jgi:hypothetical protein
MRRLYATIALLLLSIGLTHAQGAGGAGGLSNQNTLSPTWTTVGTAPGVNPSNPQDLTNLSNPQDMTLPRASNPQDLTR